MNVAAPGNLATPMAALAGLRVGGGGNMVPDLAAAGLPLPRGKAAAPAPAAAG